MAELRRRQGQSPKDDQDPPNSPPEKNNSKPCTSGQKPLLTVLAYILLAAALGTTILYAYTNRTSHLGSPNNPRIYTPTELAQFTGIKSISWWPGRGGGRILLGCMGKVFDVTNGYRHYGPGGGYSFFSGRDASRSFVTGDFENDLTDDIADLSAEDVASIHHWREFYETSQDYKFVGKVIGRFYNDHGEALPLLIESEKRVAEFRAQEAAREAAEQASKVVESLCNVSWKKSEGGWVYCKEGTVPRKMGIPVEDRSNSGQQKVQERCICVDKNEKVTEGKKVYEGCSVESSRCQTSKPGED